MSKLRSLITWIKTRPIYLRIGLVFLLGIALLAVLIAASTAPAAQQPVAFNHKTMVSKGISCVYCHAGVLRSETATIPSLEKCMGCHKTNDKNNPEIAKLMDYWNQQQPIPWVRVITLPRFVHFSHQVHVVSGAQNCEACHGDVSQMTVFQQPVHINMGWCIACHNKQANAQELNSCETCHQ